MAGKKEQGCGVPEPPENENEFSGRHDGKTYPDGDDSGTKRPCSPQADEKEAEFVDSHRPALIQRVTTVMPIVDVLHRDHMINDELYCTIQSARPRQEQMRELYKALTSGGARVKSAFYRLLQGVEPHLVQDLEGTSQIQRINLSEKGRSQGTENRTTPCTDSSMMMSLSDQKMLLQNMESFIGHYEDHERGLKSNARKFNKLAIDVNYMVRKTKNYQNAGKAAGIAGLVVGAALMPFTGGASLFFAAGATGAAVGGAVCVGAQVAKAISDRTDRGQLKKIGEDFQSEIDPLTESLEEILKCMTNLEICGITSGQFISAGVEGLETIRGAHKFEHFMDRLNNSLLAVKELKIVFDCFFKILDVIFGPIVDPNRKIEDELLEVVNKCASLSKQTIEKFEMMSAACEELSCLQKTVNPD